MADDAVGGSAGKHQNGPEHALPATAQTTPRHCFLLRALLVPASWLTRHKRLAGFMNEKKNCAQRRSREARQFLRANNGTIVFVHPPALGMAADEFKPSQAKPARVVVLVEGLGFFPVDTIYLGRRAGSRTDSYTILCKSFHQEYF
mmetsp:Transcript_2018/g.5373  ORF Transcript_2018/g.5373 Transcript_2018/m.5373 type:complete len:146 (+) Transcript_2018:52-489(+)